MTKPDDNLTGWGAIALLVIILLCTAADAWYASRVYGDWTCAFSRCVRVRP